MSNETVKIEVELPKIKGYRDVGFRPPMEGELYRTNQPGGAGLVAVEKACINFPYSCFILEPEPWQPERGEGYWTIGRGSIPEQGLVSRRKVWGDDDGLDTFLWAAGMVYRTQPHANAVALAIRDLLKSMPEPQDEL